MGVSYFLVDRECETVPERSASGTRELPPVGPVDSLRSAIDALYPGIDWQFEHGHWWGVHKDDNPRAHFEVAMTPDANGLAKLVQVDRAYREFAIELARQLGLAVFDPQEGDFIAL